MFNVQVKMTDGTSNAWKIETVEELLEEIEYTLLKDGNIDSITIKDPEILL